MTLGDLLSRFQTLFLVAGLTTLSLLTIGPAAHASDDNPSQPPMRRPMQTIEEPSTWTFLLRGMVFAGMQTTPFFQKQGGEMELSMCVPFARHGYLHRIFSLGPYAGVINSSLLLGGSAILRAFVKDSLVEPEFRLRVGTLGGTMMVGFNAGLGFPFGSETGAHLSGFFELGSLAPLSLSTYNLWASLGVGVHF